MSASSKNTPKRILVIEDDLGLVKTLSNLLQIEGYNVITASDGDSAIRIAFSEMPDLIICDIVMTRINGYDVLRILKSGNKTASIPFIYLSGKVKENEIEYGLNLGADEYLCKPFEYDDLLEAINKLLMSKDTDNNQSINIIRNNHNLAILSF